MGVEPVPGAPAAVADLGDERALVVADYHAGIERVLRSEGVELADGSDGRRRRLLALVAETDPDRLVVLGDLVHAIGDPWEAERAELETLFDALSVPVTLVKGNHDGAVEPFLADLDHEIVVTPSGGTRLGSVGFVHGHTWPARDVLAADTVCVGHEHPIVRLEDEVGGYRTERAWLRGRVNPAPFVERDEASAEFERDESSAEFEHDAASANSDTDGDAVAETDADLVVFPAFNDLSGGTWVNVEEFLSPFLPEALAAGEAYLLDGTRLGDYRRV